MPLVSTKVDVCQGHDACPPRAFAEYSPDVHAEGFEVVRETDELKQHGCPQHTPHGAQITRGWPTVKVNDLPIGHVDARVSCASQVVDTGRPSVKVGEGSELPY
jgi:uncharacterized Zn-binding protein involved in type VI secretion